VAIANDWRRAFAAGQAQRDLVLLLTVASVVTKSVFWPLYLWLVERPYPSFKHSPEFWIGSFAYFSCVGVVLASGIRSIRLHRVSFAFSGDLLISALLVTAAITLGGPKVQGSLAGNSSYLPFLLWIGAVVEFTRTILATPAR